jgi:hypothetical protein
MLPDYELAELVGRIGNFYAKKGLSPPFFLRDAAREWHGLSQDEIVAIIDNHFRDYRHCYIAGAGDQHFHMVRSAIQRAIEAKYPRDRFNDELERPRRKHRGGVRPVPHLAGVDIFDDRDDGAGQEDDRTINVERSSRSVGCERVGVPSLEDDVEADG